MSNRLYCDILYSVNLNKYINDTRKEHANIQAAIIPNLTKEDYFVLIITSVILVFLKKTDNINFLKEN